MKAAGRRSVAVAAVCDLLKWLWRPGCTAAGVAAHCVAAEVI
jgi:hypothetical protein